MKLLFVIGMQKSGTSLLNRMLMKQEFINNPFLPEGKFFWGDNPPFTPTDKPTGVLYQKHKGDHGHYLDEYDFIQSDRRLLDTRINNAQVKEAILMNKNPYNSVRIKWLKALFPNCKIVAMYRAPVPNIYSLLKKYVQHDGLKVGPENGWWGIKPKNWHNMLSEDKVEQSCRQWSAVNHEIFKNNRYIDRLINYKDLCKNPNNIIQDICSLCDVKDNTIDFDHCKNMNQEYLSGSRLQSKNKEFRHNENFDLSGLKEEIEFAALSKEQIKHITQACYDVWQNFKALPRRGY